MRSLWILPDRNQLGDLDVIEDDQRRKLSDVIDVGSVPLELTLGIPESVLEAQMNPHLIYAQFVRLGPTRAEALGADAIFALSVRCGKDKTNRTVVLTLIQLLAAEDKPNLLPSALLPEPEHNVWSELQSRFRSNDGGDRFVQYVDRMLEAVESHQSLKSFVSLDIPRTVHRPEWEPRGSIYGVKKKRILIGAGTILLLLVILLLMHRL